MYWRLIIFAALGGFLFGYETSVINGALFQMKDYFDLSEHSWTYGLIVSIAIVGAFVGSFASSFISARWGRRSCIALADVFFTLGSLLMAFANHVSLILVGRLIVGFGIGLSSATIPVYLAEITPAASRGAAIVFNNVSITGAQFIASVVTALFVIYTEPNLGWRLALGLGAVPSLIQLVALLVFLPETPRWYLAYGRVEEANRVASAFNIDIGECTEGEKLVTDFTALLTKTMRKRLFLGCMLHVLQQTSGINTLMYYSTVIMSDAGFKDKNMPLLMFIPLAGVNTLFSVFGVFTVDKWGRRSLLIISSYGCLAVTIAMTVIGFYLHEDAMADSGKWAFFSMMCLYLMFFAPGLGAMPWVVLGEVFPTKLRTSAASVATMCNWGSNALVSLVFPSILGAIGVGGTFAILCGCIAIAVAFIQIFMVETKGLSLEEIEKIFDAAANSGTSQPPSCHGANEPCNEPEANVPRSEVDTELPSGEKKCDAHRA
uniref:Uncharacterized protein TCIL3000_11_5590 n=1 Tax=Trypanosoma congolense (strain IL3000) TaxID=1068625 RepID=G0V0H4_TRYCI|nr:unnamed protein product [Trypanosoma congolense IL3000]